MVVVVPVDADIHEAQDVGEQGRSKRRERGEVRAVRRLQLQNHDRDDDSDHAVAERFEPAFPHHEKLTHPSHAHDRSPHRYRGWSTHTYRPLTSADIFGPHGSALPITSPTPCSGCSWLSPATPTHSRSSTSARSVPPCVRRTARSPSGPRKDCCRRSATCWTRTWSCWTQGRDCSSARPPCSPRTASRRPRPRSGGRCGSTSRQTAALDIPTGSAARRVRWGRGVRPTHCPRSTSPTGGKIRLALGR